MVNSISRQLAIGVALLGLFPLSSHARDLQGRLGVGYNAQFANTTQTNGVPALALKYAFTRDIATELVGGVATTTPSNSVVGFKIFKNIFFETNLNFYFLAGVGFINANNKSGMQFLGGFGTEFFIPGVDSLGLSMEFGGSLDNVAGSYAFKTMGVSFLNAGMRFYF